MSLCVISLGTAFIFTQAVHCTCAWLSCLCCHQDIKIIDDRLSPRLPRFSLLPVWSDFFISGCSTSLCFALSSSAFSVLGNCSASRQRRNSSESVCCQSAGEWGGSRTQFVDDNVSIHCDKTREDLLPSSSHELLTFSVRPEPRRFETQILNSWWRGRSWRYRTAMQRQKHKNTKVTEAI